MKNVSENLENEKEVKITLATPENVRDISEVFYK